MKRKLKEIRDKLLGINDSAHRIALGVGLGLFLGVFPGTGAIAAIVGAFILRANKAAALAAALLVNTWINVVTFPLAVAIGAFVLRVDPKAIAQDWSRLTGHFSWNTLWDLLLRDTVLVLLAGYVLMGLVLGIAGYLLTYALIRKVRKKRGTTA
jgi:uncharacterized protein (DUF2062 family)